MKNTNILASGYNWSAYVIGFLLSTGNRLYVGCFGTLMLPLSGLAIIAYITAFIFAPAVDIDGIREPVGGSLLYGEKLGYGGTKKENDLRQKIKCQHLQTFTGFFKQR